MLPAYAPESYVDFSQPDPRAKMLAALKQVGSELGRTYPLWINGEPVTTKETFTSTSPADPDRVVGVMCQANAELADRAVRGAAEAFKSWSRVDAESRARVLRGGSRCHRAPRVGAGDCAGTGLSLAEAG